MPLEDVIEELAGLLVGLWAAFLAFVFSFELMDEFFVAFFLFFSGASLLKHLESALALELRAWHGIEGGGVDAEDLADSALS